MAAIKLDDSAELETRSGQYGPYVCLSKEYTNKTKGNQYRRCIFFSTDKWEKLVEVIPQVTEVLQQQQQQQQQNADDGQEWILALNDHMRLTVSKFQGKMYVGLHSLDDQQELVRSKCINLVDSCWQKLIKNTGKIARHLKKKQPSTTATSSSSTLTKARRGSASSTIKQYGWQSKDGQEHWYYSLKECQQDAEHAGIGIFQSKMVPPPQPKDLMTEAYAYLLRQAIKRISREQCFGCGINHGSQSEHMQAGCLSEWSDLVMTYYSDAVNSVTDFMIAELYCGLIDKLGLKLTEDPTKLAIEVQLMFPVHGDLTAEMKQPNFDYLLALC